MGSGKINPRIRPLPVAENRYLSHRIRAVAAVLLTKKKRHQGACSFFAMEAEVGIEPAYTALQAAA
jgi:hypothetical protein